MGRIIAQAGFPNFSELKVASLADVAALRAKACNVIWQQDTLPALVTTANGAYRRYVFPQSSGTAQNFEMLISAHTSNGVGDGKLVLYHQGHENSAQSIADYAARSGCSNAQGYWNVACAIEAAENDLRSAMR